MAVKLRLASTDCHGTLRPAPEHHQSPQHVELSMRMVDSPSTPRWRGPMSTCVAASVSAGISPSTAFFTCSGPPGNILAVVEPNTLPSTLLAVCKNGDW